MNKKIQLEPVLHWFVASKTTHFDEGHNINHILNVVSNATKIYNNTEEKERHNTDLNLILVCCYLHDIRDHKMTNDDQTITETELRQFISSIGYNPDLIISITNLVSFSKEKKLEDNIITYDNERVLGIDKERGSGYSQIISMLEQSIIHSDNMTIQQLEYIRNVVSDADKIEALGEIGISRCKSYGRHIGYTDESESIPRIVEHCEYKLLHLKDVYIHTEAGKEMVSDGHDYVLKWYELERGRLGSDFVSDGLVI